MGVAGVRADRLPSGGTRIAAGGALNFAITNSVGAYLTLSGIGRRLRAPPVR